MVSIDTAVNSPAIAGQIIEQEGHYLLSLKTIRRTSLLKRSTRSKRLHDALSLKIS
ncbi:hypothetical protein [Tunicatimonas pelagia]|uniref:hypothetical protein n=1 Tax=Tunicatimonas pelagia TaxID=931531 RepID=UPI002664E7AD|nr:hypothetical protein [Tunicatimonas pelagia]WKN42231.1 hypothetical protein P0M28_24645 [Tunicatimonas pelagia]